VEELTPQSIEAMEDYFERWLPESITGRRFLDIGSGSGLSSLVAFQRGARVTSFDVDPRSVDATMRLRALADAPGDWSVLQGSILDEAFLEGLDLFDIVLAWGSCTTPAISGALPATAPIALAPAVCSGSRSTGKGIGVNRVSG
jgi:SAM-dependent methyltransferase